MKISTFNNWFWVAPAILLLAVLLAVFSVTEKNSKAKYRGSDKLWSILMYGFCFISWGVLVYLLVIESLRGMVEFWGRDREGVVMVSIFTFFVVAGLWVWFVYTAFMAVRRWRFNLLDYACSHGHSKADRQRRRRIQKKIRSEQKLRKKHSKLIEDGKILIMPTHDDYIPPAQSDESTEPLDALQSETADPLAELLAAYRIERRTDLTYAFHADGETQLITEYLPDGTDAYFIAVNVDDENDQIFVGWDQPEENLRRYLEMRQGDTDSAINQ